MMGTLKIEITLPQEDIDSFWEDATSLGEDVLGMKVERKETIKIDGHLMARREPRIWANMMANISVGDVLTQANEFLNKKG